MLDKYIQIKDNKIVVGQNSNTGAWYCKELPFKDETDLDIKIGKINKVLNKYNKQNNKKEKKVPTPEKKEKTSVKGLK